MGYLLFLLFRLWPSLRPMPRLNLAILDPTSSVLDKGITAAQDSTAMGATMEPTRPTTTTPSSPKATCLPTTLLTLDTTNTTNTGANTTEFSSERLKLMLNTTETMVNFKDVITTDTTSTTVMSTLP